MTRLADLAWPAAAARSTALLVVPLGATEQHGPHLPLSTDTDVALGLADRLAAARRDVVVAPALPYGASGEHAAFPGTLSLGQQALETVLVELVRSATGSFDHVLLISGHGGNAAPVRCAVSRLRQEGRDVRAWSPRWDGDAHAGRTETSLQLVLNPDRTDIANAVPGELTPIDALLPALRRSGVRAISPSGVLGDPSGASLEQGRALLDDAVAQLVRWLDGWPAPAP